MQVAKHDTRHAQRDLDAKNKARIQIMRANNNLYLRMGETLKK